MYNTFVKASVSIHLTSDSAKKLLIIQLQNITDSSFASSYMVRFAHTYLIVHTHLYIIQFLDRRIDVEKVRVGEYFFLFFKSEAKTRYTGKNLRKSSGRGGLRRIRAQGSGNSKNILCICSNIHIYTYTV